MYSLSVYLWNMDEKCGGRKMKYENDFNNWFLNEKNYIRKCFFSYIPLLNKAMESIENRPVNILELGTGFSTGYIYNFLGGDVNIITFDFNKAYLKKWEEIYGSDSKITLIFCHSIKEIVTKLKTINGKKFDLVFIDSDIFDFEFGKHRASIRTWVLPRICNNIEKYLVFHDAERHEEAEFHVCNLKITDSHIHTERIVLNDKIKTFSIKTLVFENRVGET